MADSTLGIYLIEFPRTGPFLIHKTPPLAVYATSEGQAALAARELGVLLCNARLKITAAPPGATVALEGLVQGQAAEGAAAAPALDRLANPKSGRRTLPR